MSSDTASNSVEAGRQRYLARSTPTKTTITPGEIRITGGTIQDGIDHYTATHPTTQQKDNR